MVVGDPEPGAVDGVVATGKVEDGAEGDDVLGVVAAPPPAADSGGKLELVLVPAAVEAPDPPPANTLPISMPKTDATPAAITSCHVRHDRCSLIPNSPGAGTPDADSAVACSLEVLPTGASAEGGGGEGGGGDGALNTNEA